MRKIFVSLVTFLFSASACVIFCFASGFDVSLTGNELFYYFNSDSDIGSYMIDSGSGGYVRGIFNYSSFRYGDSVNTPVFYSDQFMNPSDSRFTFNLPASKDCVKCQVRFGVNLSSWAYPLSYSSGGNPVEFVDSSGKSVILNSNFFFSSDSVSVGVYNDGQYLTTLSLVTRPPREGSYLFSSRLSGQGLDLSSLGVYRSIQSLFDNKISSFSWNSYNSPNIGEGDVCISPSSMYILYLDCNDFDLDKFGDLSFTIIGNYTFDNPLDIVGVKCGDVVQNFDFSKMFSPSAFFVGVSYSVSPSDSDIFIGKIQDIIDSAAGSIKDSLDSGFSSVNDNLSSIHDDLVSLPSSYSEVLASQDSFISSAGSVLDSVGSDLAVTLSPVDSSAIDSLFGLHSGAGHRVEEHFGESHRPSNVGSPWGILTLIFDSGSVLVDGHPWVVWCLLIVLAFGLVSLILHGMRGT